jgi:hypothetical protein
VKEDTDSVIPANAGIQVLFRHECSCEGCDSLSSRLLFTFSSLCAHNNKEPWFGDLEVLGENVKCVGMTAVSPGQAVGSWLRLLGRACGDGRGPASACGHEQCIRVRADAHGKS